MPTALEEDIQSSHGSDTRKYHEISSYDTCVEHDDACFEETPLLGDKSHRHLVTRSYSRERLRPRLLSRSSSVTSSVPAEKLSIWRLSRSQKITLVVTSWVDLLTYLSISIMAPFFPEEALKKGVSDSLSGWIFGTAPFVTFIVSPFIGKLMPYIGVRFQFLSGLFLFSGCTILFGMLAYVPVDNGIEVFVALAFLLQVIRSIGISATSTSCFVMCIREFPDNVSTVFGFGELFVGLGLVAGPGLGGLLYGLDGFYLPFVSIGVLGMLCIPVTAYAIPSSVAVPVSTDDEEEVPFRKIFCTPQAVVISLIIITSTFCWAILDPTLEPHLRQFGLSPEIVGVIFLVMASVYGISSPIGGWLADKVDDPRPIIIIGFIFLSLGSLLIGPSPLLGLDPKFSGLWLVIVSLVILGASASFTAVPTFDMLFTLAQERGSEGGTRTYGMVAGFWMSMYSLGDFIGPSVGGVLLDTVGFEIMCTYSAGISLLLALIVTFSWIFDLKCCERCYYSTHDNKSSDFVYESFESNPCYRVTT